MELDASQLYADKTYVRTELCLSVNDKKSLLTSAKEFADGLAVDGLACEVEKLSGGSFLPWGSNKALVLRAEFGEFEFQGILTVNQFGSACVASCYKQWLGDNFFAVNHSPEARKRVILDKLQDIERIDYFFLVDHALDRVATFLSSALEELAGEP